MNNRLTSGAMGYEAVTRPSPKRKATVLLVQDHPLVRENLARFINLHTDLIVCGEASNSREGAAAAVRLRPDLAIVDLALGKESGLWLIGLLRDRTPDLPVLVLSMHEEDLFALPALQAGARGFVMKQDAAKELSKAIRNVLDGEIYLSPQLRQRFWKERRQKRGIPAA